jgi:putative heme-binding domain-containing protein
VAKHAPDFMRAKDTWFRGIDLLTGPDGNVFVADWSDSGECHDNDGVHRSSGRIYKIVYQGEGSPSKGAHAPASGPRALSFEDLLRGDTPAGFSKAVERGGWWARMATQLRNERLNLQVPANVFQEGVFPADWTELPASPLSEKAKWYADFTTHITTRGGDSDPRRRLALASVMQRLPLEERWRIARQLVRHAEDAEDRQQPLMIWYGIEPSVAADPLQGIRLIAESSIPTVRRLIARRISELIEEQPRAVDALVELMVHQESVRGDVLAGMAAGLDGFSNAQRPKGWDDVLFEKWSAAQPRPAATGAASAEMLVRQLSVIFGSGRAAHELVGLIKNGNADAPARLNALKSLTRTGQPEVLPALLTLINDKVLAVPARKALAAFEDPSIPGLLLGAWTGRSQEVQSATVATLASRPSFARALLSAIREGKIPRSALSPSDARQIRNLGDPSLAELLSEVWGQVRDTSVEKKSEFARWESLLKPTAIAGADRSKGRLLFQSVCGACHKMFGQGGAIGPELTGSDRRNLKYLLENILDPNAVVAADFQVSIFRLKDGRTLTGVVPEQTEHTVTIQTPSERLTMERKQIVHREQMPQSLMPEGLLSALGDENARHLFAYLMGEGQAELPK